MRIADDLGGRAVEILEDGVSLNVYPLPRTCSRPSPERRAVLRSRLGESRAKRVDDVLLVAGLDLREERERERPARDVLGDRADAFSEPELLPHVRLEMDAGTYSATSTPRSRSSAITRARSISGASATTYTNQERLWSASSAGASDALDALEQFGVPAGYLRAQLQRRSSFSSWAMPIAACTSVQR